MQDQLWIVNVHDFGGSCSEAIEPRASFGFFDEVGAKALETAFNNQPKVVARGRRGHEVSAWAHPVDRMPDGLDVNQAVDVLMAAELVAEIFEDD